MPGLAPWYFLLPFLAKWMRQKFQHSRKLTQAVWKEVSVSRMGGSDDAESDGVRLKEKKRKKKGRKKRDGKKVMLGCGWMAQWGQPSTKVPPYLIPSSGLNLGMIVQKESPKETLWNDTTRTCYHL